MVEDGSLIQDQCPLPAAFFSEVGVARRIREIVSTPTSFDIDGIDKIIRSIEERDRIKYDQVQKEAIKRADLQIHGATGKLEPVRLSPFGIIIFEDSADIFMAPTGRAAKRMEESTEGGKDHPQMLSINHPRDICEMKTTRMMFLSSMRPPWWI